MIQARALHTATLLSDGGVLVTGGWPSISSAEVYDPVTGTWSTAGSMTIAHWFHTAIILNDGPVLVIGGFTDEDSDSISIAELYDPVTATWSVTGQRLITSRGDHMTTPLADGRVLVAGGTGDTSFVGTLSSAEIYDPTADTFSRTARMIRPRYSHTGTRLNNGQVLVTGGFNCVGGVQPSCELYTP